MATIKPTLALLVCILLLTACDKSFLFPDFSDSRQGPQAKTAPPDPCLSSICPPNSSCVDGDCRCNDGLEGPLCAKEYADKFVGSYQGYDTCNGVAYVTVMPEVVTKTNAKTIKITNFSGFGPNQFILAEIQKETPEAPAANKIVFDFTDQALRHFEGSGVLIDGDVYGKYEITYSDGSVEICSFSLDRL